MPRPTISQRIALEGGDEVKRQLNELGETGKKAFQKLQDAARGNESLNALSPTFEGLRARAAELGITFGQLGSRIHNVGGAVRETAVAGGILATAIAGTLVDQPNEGQLTIQMCVVDAVADDEHVGYGETDEIRIDCHFAATWLVDKRASEDGRCSLLAEQIARVKKRPSCIYDVVNKQYRAAG